MGSWIQGAKDFALEQAPLFAQEYVKWYATDHIRLAISLSVTIGIFIWGAKKANIVLCRMDDGLNDDFIKFVRCIISLICFVVCTVLTICAINSLGSAVKAYVAPRVVIVEGIKDILNFK
jgi:hypothetical protein